ncbi:NAD(P)-dependent alcohol dehydrogenase [Sphaerisporangium viridialbum]|uniref:NAD(P)-dependent alcohol dehydrogenase n=1 Tax=Sphaerisporangium viridialbum TaxID=46189 RepID=UPI003C722A43
MAVSAVAAVLHGPGARFSLETIRLGDLRPHELLVEVRAAGLCHTDLMPRVPFLGERLVPIVLGHEGAGVVIEVGSAVTTIRPGDHVLLSFDSCGDCERCRADDPAYCLHFRAMNTSGQRLDGSVAAVDEHGIPVANRWFGQSSFATLAIATERNAVVIDPSLPLDVLAPLGCGLQTGAGAVLNEMKLRPGQSVAVLGAGAVGLAAVMAAKIAGASDIVAIDLHASRLELAKQLGATRRVLGEVDDLRKAIVGDGPGLDFVLDTTGVPEVIKAGVAALRPHGRALLVGAGASPVSFHPSELTGVNVGYILEGSANPKRFLPELVAHWRAGRFPIERLTATYPLSDIDTAEADMLAGQVVKPVLVIG